MRLVRRLAFAPHGLWQRRGAPAHSLRAFSGVVPPDELSKLESPFILDVRDPEESKKGKGGPPDRIAGSVNVPLNVDGVGQRERPTTADEFLEKLERAGVALPDDGTPIITHCGGGGRGGKAADILKGLGYNAYNGGGPANIAKAYGER